MGVDRIIAIDSGYFYAGVVVGGPNNTVKRAAPILKYMKDWKDTDVLAYCKKKKWLYHDESQRESNL